MQVLQPHSFGFRPFGTPPPVSDPGAAAGNVFKNGSFDEPATGNSTTGWVGGGGWQVGGGVANLPFTGGNNDLRQSVSTADGFTAGSMYRLSVSVTAFSGGTIQILNDSGGNYQNAAGLQAVGLFTVDFTATNSNEQFYFRAVDCAATLAYIRLEKL